MGKSSIAVAALLCIPLFCVSISPHASAGDKTEIEQLKESNKQLQERIDQLEKHFNTHIEPEKAISKDSSMGESFSGDKGDVEPPKEYEMQIQLRDSFNDRQIAAPRPYDMTLDPKYQGFIPIPHTHGLIQFNARPRVDITNDNKYSGNDDRFTTASIPVSGEITKGGGYQFNMNAQGSRLSMDVRGPKVPGNPRFYYENDFAGTGNQYLNYRVRHLYGEFYNFVVGQTYTIFEDADSWPDTVDYEGPNAAISARRPLIRYILWFNENWGMNLSIEKPDPQVDTSNDPSATSEIHAPDGGFNIRWANKEIGHVQLATIFRNIAVSGDLVGSQNVFGWGVNLSSSLNLFEADSFQTQLTYGQGIFYFMNDAIENNDAAFNAAGKLKPLPVIAAMAGYTHSWAKKWRSTASFGFVNLENEYSQDWNTYHRTYYASANLVFQLFKRLAFGAEGLYGYKQVKSGASGDVFRGQLTIMYALFK